MRRSLVVSSLIASCLSLAAAPAPLSDPVGVFALIDRVVLAPDATNPTSIQLWGVFALADPGNRDNYLDPQRGYLHYSLNRKNERATLAEWSDMRRIAGTGQPLGFGGRYEPLGRVRSAAEPPGKPDVYPLGFGLVRDLTWQTRSAVAYGILRVPSPVSPAAGARVSSGAVRLVARNVADPSVRYIFEISGGGERESSQPLGAGSGETTWAPGLRLRAGQTYTWSVRATTGEWTGAPATVTFTAAS